MEGRLLLNVIILESATVLELLTSEDKALLIRRDALIVLDLGFDVLDRVALLHIKSDRLASQGLHEDLHATAQTKYQVKSGLLLDIVVL